MPEKMDVNISDIMELINKLRTKSARPLMIDEFSKCLEPTHKEILKLIFSEDRPNFVGLREYYLQDLKEDERRQYYELKEETCEDLKRFLFKSIVKNQFLFSIDELMEKLKSE